MLIQLIGHTTYALLALSYLVRDIYWLRLLAIPASICSIAFCYFNTPDHPVWLIIGWNLIFLTVNIWQVGVLHWQRFALNRRGELSRFIELLGPTEGDVIGEPIDLIDEDAVRFGVVLRPRQSTV